MCTNDPPPELHHRLARTSQGKHRSGSATSRLSRLTKHHPLIERFLGLLRYGGAVVVFAHRKRPLIWAADVALARGCGPKGHQQTTQPLRLGRSWLTRKLHESPQRGPSGPETGVPPASPLNPPFERCGTSREVPHHFAQSSAAALDGTIPCNRGQGEVILPKFALGGGSRIRARSDDESDGAVALIGLWPSSKASENKFLIRVTSRVVRVSRAPTPSSPTLVPVIATPRDMPRRVPCND